MSDVPLRGSSSLLPLIIDSLFGDAVAGSQAPAAPVRAMVSLPEERSDVNGTKFVSYPIRVSLDVGGELRTERRYTEFAAMHDEVHVALAQPAAFPVSQMNLPRANYLLGWPAREEMLQEYLDSLLEESTMRSPALPTLTAFFRLAPYVATGVPHSACLSALPNAAPVQCIAMMRAILLATVLCCASATLSAGNISKGSVPGVQVCGLHTSIEKCSALTPIPK